MNSRLTAVLIGTLLAMAGAAHGQASGPASPRDRCDVLGRPVPWGKEVDGQVVSLWVPYARFLYGQPIDLRVEARAITDRPPLLRLRFDGSSPTVFVKCTADGGEPVELALSAVGFSSCLQGTLASFRLQPVGNFARGPFLAPGAYTMRVVIETAWNPGDPVAWVGRIESNVVELEVIDSLDELDRVPESKRADAMGLMAELDAPTPEERDRAQQRLVAAR